ncbi:hypothetical protein D8770_01835 [Methylobacterium sp. DB1607]|nr:hypothetical protein [Methylobacterium sp. DB1607]
MGTADGAAALDAWPRVRQPRFALRRGRLQPGPLKFLDRRDRRPAWSIAAGLLGLSLITTWAIASQIRSSDAVSEQTALVAGAEPAQDEVRPVRSVVINPAAPDSEAPAAIEAARQLSTAITAPEPQPVVSVAPAAPVSKPVSTQTIDLGALPILTLDETAFDAAPAPLSENPAPTAPRVRARP